MSGATEDNELAGIVGELKSGRLLQSFDLQREIKQTNERLAIEAASDAFLSRLTVDDDMPVRFDPPVHEARKRPDPAYFYSGDGRNHSRSHRVSRGFKRFGIR